MSDTSTISVTVSRRLADPSGAISFELRSNSNSLPAFQAGSHIDLFLPNGLIRSYSLMNNQKETDRYVVGVGLDKNSRGGSVYLHEQVKTGTRLEISPPSNLFPLNEAAPRSVMFAGGIGITPFISMIERLKELNKDWQLHYCARSRKLAPFLEQLSTHSPNVVFHFDDESQGEFIDIPSLITSEAPGTHYYCCGPAPMMSAFELACIRLPVDTVHMERFAPIEAPATQGGFTVELSPLGKSVRVPRGKTILEALQSVGVEIPFSCLAGVCGTCQMRVLAGTPDHRDLILTDKEKEENKVMMVCCSGSLSDVLVLEL
jgi:vanillate O-demethylase ferredoxin subunit